MGSPERGSADLDHRRRAHPDGCDERCAGDRPGPSPGGRLHRGDLAAHRGPAGAYRRGHPGQRDRRGTGTEPRAAGGVVCRTAPWRRCHDREQGLRVGAQGHHAGRPGHSPGRVRAGRRRRHGEHEPCSLPADPRPRGLSPGERRAGRRDDPRRPVGRVQPEAHGHMRRFVRINISVWPPGAGRLRGAELHAGPSGDRGRCLRRRGCSRRGRFSGEDGARLE